MSPTALDCSRTECVGHAPQLAQVIENRANQCLFKRLQDGGSGGNRSGVLRGVQGVQKEFAKY